MAMDILGQLTSQLPENFTHFASASLGESLPATERAIETGGATLLASVMQDSADPARSRGLFETITGSGVDSSLLRRLPAVLGDKSQFQSLISSGESLVGSLLGPRAGSVGTALSQVAGVKASSAVSIVSMLAPMLLGLLKSSVVQGGLDRGGLTSLLLSQKDKLQQAGLDQRLTSALGFSDLPNMLHHLPSPGAVPPPVTQAASRAGQYRWVLAAIAVLAAIGIIAAMLINKARHNTSIASVPATAERLIVASTSVYFEPGTTSLDSKNQAVVAGIADTVRTTGQTVTVTGYSDNRRTPDDLASNRAAAVRTALLSGGVPDARIIVTSPSSTASTDADLSRVEVRSIAPTRNR